jgi:hypothetical protein
MAKKRKTTPVSDADPSEANAITEEPAVQGSPVPEDFGEKVEQTMAEVGAGQERISLPLGMIPRDVQGSPVSARGAEDSSGKPGLPEPEPEPAWPDGTEADEDEEEIVAFSEQDRKDLTRLETQIDASTREQAEALREIRRRQLWRLEKDDLGGQRYASFEVYCRDRWGHPRQWVTHLTNWLRVVEEGERLGIRVPLTIKAAQGLLIGRLREAGGLRAVLEDAKEDGVPLDRDHLREIVLRRADFSYWSKEGKAGSTKPAAKTYAKYKQDLATIREIANARSDNSVVGKAQQLDGDFPENLVALCEKERVLPRPDQLLAVLTGRALEEVVSRLTDLAKEAAEIEEKKTRLEARRKEIKAMEQEGGLKKLKEEARSLERELEEKGVLQKRKKGAPQQELAPDGAASGIRVVSAEEGDVEEGDMSEIRQSLTLALDNLDEALTADWPDEADELNAILSTAQDCESKLAEIFDKAKELVVDATEPEGVPSGND